MARIAFSTGERPNDVLRKALMTLAQRTDDYPEKEQVEEVLQGIKLQEQIDELRRQNEARRAEELYLLAKRELEASAGQRTQEDEAQEGPGEARGSNDQQRPNIRAIKVVKVNVEEEEDFKESIKRFVITAVASLIIQMTLPWIYNRCRKRNQTTRKEPKEDFEEESLGCDMDIRSSEDDEFEMISLKSSDDESSKPKFKPSDDAVEVRREEQKVIYVTRSGEKYHLQSDCKNTTSYVIFERTPCETCKDQSKKVLTVEESSSSNRSETRLFISTKDRHYHHPSCEKMWTSRSKDPRIRCIDCEKVELARKNEKGKKDK